MTVRVDAVSIPAWSTIGTCQGVDVETGERVTFAADHRPARDLGAAIQYAKEQGDEDELPVADVEDWQVLGRSE